MARDDFLADDRAALRAEIWCGEILDGLDGQVRRQGALARAAFLGEEGEDFHGQGQAFATALEMSLYALS